MQKYLDKPAKLSTKWEEKFDSKKCTVMELGKSGQTGRNYKMGMVHIISSREKNNLGVTFTDSHQKSM